MTICNMAVECGARGVVMAPDDAVFAWLEGRPRVPQGALWDQAVAQWRTLCSDPEAPFDREVHIEASHIEPMVTWGTSPDQAAPIGARVPDPAAEPDAARRRGMERALSYMDWTLADCRFGKAIGEMRTSSSCMLNRRTRRQSARFQKRILATRSIAIR